ncbi:acyltransferase family protein [Methylobacterium sp. A54F]
MTARDGRIAGFDGLRAIAFLMVFVSHKVPTTRTDALGSAGVWLFFVLSGFLITRILAREREAVEAGDLTPGRALAAFYGRRTARIAPVYYVFLAVLTALSLHGLVDLGETGRQVANWLYLTDLYVERHGWGTDLGHLWSLAVEEQFYIVFAPLVLYLPRARLGATCAGLVGLGILSHVVLWRAGGDRVAFDVNPLVNLTLLALGGLAGLAAGRPLPRLLRGSAAMVLALLIFVLLPLVAAPTGLWLMLGRVSGLLVALLLVQIVQNQEAVAVRLLDTPILRGIGLVSYGAYLFHPVVHAGRLLAPLGLAPTPAAGVVLDLAISLALAAASWRLFERPLRAGLIALGRRPARVSCATG